MHQMLGVKFMGGEYSFSTNPNKIHTDKHKISYVESSYTVACSKTCGNPACTCADAAENIKPITVMATGNEVS